MPETVMIFAAGFGTRMGDLTRSCPKPMIKVAGKPLIDHALRFANRANLRSVVNVHYLSEQIEAHLADRDNVQVIVEQPEILDTGGGLKNALPMLGTSPVFTLNSDAVWQGPNPLELLLANWHPDRMEALLLLVPQPRTIGYDRGGNFSADADGAIKRDQTGQVYTGAQIIKTDRFAQVEQSVFSMNLIWDQMLATGTAFGLEYPGYWADVGTPAGITLAEDMLAGVANVSTQP